MPATRVTLLYTGRVQGVGFRASASSAARKFDVTGTVRNLPDGRVELVAEGEPNTVAAFLAAVAGRMRSHIDGVDRTVSPATGEFDAFDVAR